MPMQAFSKDIHSYSTKSVQFMTCGRAVSSGGRIEFRL